MLDRTSPKPLHTQMEEHMRKQLATGAWAYGQPIPSENVLSAQYGVSRMTVRNVITKLVLEELLYRVPGKGTYVKSPKILANPLSYAGIREQLEHMGYEVNTKLLESIILPADEHLAKKLKIDAGTDIYFIKRLRFMRGIPLSLHMSFIPAGLCPNLEKSALENEQLCHILADNYGLKPASTNETLESIAATREEASLLEVKTGHPLLLLEDTITALGDKIYEFSKVVFRGDKIKIHLLFQ